jgi:hypothetical protein
MDLKVINRKGYMFILPFSIIYGVEKQVIVTLPFCKFSSLKRSKSAPQLHKEKLSKSRMKTYQ